MIEKNCICSNNLIEQLKSSWFNLLKRSASNMNLGHKVFATLINSYSAKERVYHNLEHIHDILNLIEQTDKISDNIDVLQFSAWFHDYIYDSQAQDNEFQSAAATTIILEQLNINFKIIDTIEKIILSTNNHKPLLDNTDNLLFLDMDLAILGTTSDQYKKYARAIREEYNYLSDRNYQLGRKKVLNQFLARERIYYTNYFYQGLESIARNNIKTEINNLNSKYFNIY